MVQTVGQAAAAQGQFAHKPGQQRSRNGSCSQRLGPKREGQFSHRNQLADQVKRQIPKPAKQIKPDVIVGSIRMALASMVS